MHCRAIPPEMLDVIVGLVAMPLRLHSGAEREEIDVAKNTIASCALVSRQWRDIAQGHQYHDLVVDFRDPETDPNGRTLARFYSFVGDSSRLSGAVRALHLRRSLKLGKNNAIFVAEGQGMRSRRSSDCRYISVGRLTSLLVYFKRLHSLNICFDTIDLRKEEDIATSHNPYLESLTHFSCQPPQFSDNILYPALCKLLEPFVNVREITLRKLLLSDSSSSLVSVRAMCFNSLTRIIIRECLEISPILGCLQAAAQEGLPALEWLEASYLLLDESPVLWSLLATLGPRLKHLGIEFDLTWNEVEHYPQLHLAACPNLRSFDFMIENPSDTGPWDLYYLLVDILEQTLDAAVDPKTLALESVTAICYTAPQHDEPDTCTWNLAPDSMTALENVLLCFPNMRRLEFKLPTIIGGVFERFREEDRVYLSGFMPRLNEKGILVF